MTTLKECGYEEVKIIGRGQFGKAHLVKSDQDQSYLVAKAIDLTCLAEKERDVALQEVEVLRRLEHPHIVAYRDSFSMGGDTLVIVMQYCEGGDLATYIKDIARRKSRFRETQVMKYFVQLLHALKYIHQEKILHRDLKTSNLFLMRNKSVLKLGDFGIARVLEHTSEAANTVVGTPYYMSPEVCENKPYTYKSDVWSLGCIVYETCALKHAFSADNLLGLVYKIVSEKFEPIPKLYSQAISGLITGMLEKDFEQRPTVLDLFNDPYVESFVREQAQLRSKESNAAISNSGGGVAGRAARTGSSLCGGGGISGGAPGGTRRGRMARIGGHPRLPPCGGAAPGGGAPGGCDGGMPRGRSNPNLHLSPKEAIRHRKREEADRRAEELRKAAREAHTRKGIAKNMKNSNLLGGAAALAVAAPGKHVEGVTKGIMMDSTVLAASPSEVDASRRRVERTANTHTHGFLPELGVSQGPSETETSAEEYEDDFEEEYCSERSDEALTGYIGRRADGPACKVAVRRQDVVDDDLSEIEELDCCSMSGGDGNTVLSYTPERPYRDERERVQVPSLPRLRQRMLTGNPGGFRAGSPQQNTMTSEGAVGPSAGRLQAELMNRMGPETFKKAFDFVYRSRARNTDERAIRRGLEAMVGRGAYKEFCFDMDQLVFQRMLYC